MSYNLTAISENSTGLLGFTQSVNSVLGEGVFGILLLIAVYVIMFMSFMGSTQDVNKALGGSSFISFILALLLRAVGLIPDLALYISLVGLAVIIAFTWSRD